MADDEPLEPEHQFLSRLRGRLQAREAAKPTPQGARLLVGVGDDAAIFQPGAHPFAVTTDSMIEDVHFRRNWLDASELGRRAVEVNLSDLAAMAARPRFLLAAVSAPTDTPTAWLEELIDGCADAADEVGASLIGGNLARSDEVTITVTALGEIATRPLTRSGAQPGDDLVVTGTLGDAAYAVSAWTRGKQPGDLQRERWARPKARIDAGLALAEAGAHAAIDLSDGLLADLGHVCEASEVGAVIERERLPRSKEVTRHDREGADFAAVGGEDYELLVACPAGLVQRSAGLAARAGTSLTVIGRCTEHDAGIVLLDEHGDRLPLPSGFDHFAPGRGG